MLHKDDDTTFIRDDLGLILGYSSAGRKDACAREDAEDCQHVGSFWCSLGAVA